MLYPTFRWRMCYGYFRHSIELKYPSRNGLTCPIQNISSIRDFSKTSRIISTPIVVTLPRVTHEDVVYENPWLRLKTIHFLDQKGNRRKWTGIERTTTYPRDHTNTLSKSLEVQNKEKCDAVVVFPFLKEQKKPLRVILIRQFRPPVGCWVLELPAGLIDEQEEPRTAAFRELKEETGFKASRVLHMGPPMVNDQGITNGTCRLLLVEVNMEDQMNKEQELEEDEMIQVVLAPMDGLIPWLLERKEKDGDAIDARLYSYALGLQALPLSLA
jgi:8-oxo-dGTP pyrophosphatase MutT (NUDIX family)